MQLADQVGQADGSSKASRREDGVNECSWRHARLACAVTSNLCSSVNLHSVVQVQLVMEDQGLFCLLTEHVKMILSLIMLVS